MRRHTETNKKKGIQTLVIHTRAGRTQLWYSRIFAIFHSFVPVQTKPISIYSIRFESHSSTRDVFPIGGHLAAEDTCCPTRRSTSIKIPPQKRYKSLFPPQWVWFLELEHVAGCLLVLERWSGGEVKCWAAIRCHNYTSGQALWYHKMAGRDCV